jgi:hypothetical protein
VRVDEALHLLVLVEADLEEEVAAGLEVARRLRDEAADDGEAVAAGRERDTRFVLAHLALESREVGLGDVGRIGDDDVEARTGRFVVFAPSVEAV